MDLIELGFIKIPNPSGGARTIACEEISLKFSQENTPRWVCDQIFPVDIHPTKKRAEFSFKKPKLLNNDLLFYLYTHYFPFDLLLYTLHENDENDVLEPRAYITLRHCVINDVNIGNFDGTKPVTEEIQGSTLYYEFAKGTSAYKDSIRNADTQDLPELATLQDHRVGDVAIGNKKKLA
jgi:hypothetical protein